MTPVQDVMQQILLITQARRENWLHDNVTHQECPDKKRLVFVENSVKPPESLVRVRTLQTVFKVIWFMFGVDPENPSSYRQFFILSSKNPFSPILQSPVRSDLLLSSVPLPPSAICHSRVDAAKASPLKIF